MVWLATAAAPAAHADTAGDGTFDIDFDGSFPNFTFTGNLDFSGGGFVLGTPVDLQAAVGHMSYSGSVSNLSLSSTSADFTFSAETSSPGGAFLTFDVVGKAVCKNAGCVGNVVTLVGDLTVTGGTVLPGGAVYTFDGTLTVSFAGTGSGVFGINDFAEVPTPVGTDAMVSSGDVSFLDSLRNTFPIFHVDVLFPSVDEAGTTRFVGLSATPGAFPAGMTFDGDGYPSVFVDVASDATFTGPVAVCFAFADTDHDGLVDGTSVEATRLRVLHRSSVDGAFVDVTTGIVDDHVCGSADGLSPFVVAVTGVETTTTTEPDTTSTTTSTSTTSTTLVTTTSTTTITTSTITTTTTTATATTTTVTTTTTTTANPCDDACGDGIVEPECGEVCDPAAPPIPCGSATGAFVARGVDGSAGGGFLECVGKCTELDASACATTTTTTAPLTTTTATTTSTTTTTGTRPPTTTTTTSSTTTTTVAGCSGGLSLPELLCRLDALIAFATPQPVIERTRTPMLRQLANARKALLQAEVKLAQGRLISERSRVKVLERRIIGFNTRIDSANGRRDIAPSLRADMHALSDPLLADVRTVLKTF